MCCLRPACGGEAIKPFGVEQVRIHQVVNHGLEIVRVRAANVGGDDDAKAFTGQRAAGRLGRSGVRMTDPDSQEKQQEEKAGKIRGVHGSLVYGMVSNRTASPGKGDLKSRV
jgi:predicted flavoprotein YhiN